MAAFFYVQEVERVETARRAGLNHVQDQPVKWVY